MSARRCEHRAERVTHQLVAELETHTLELAGHSVLSAEQREKLCWRNAADLYGIDVSVDIATG